jgi:hypothetical protein
MSRLFMILFAVAGLMSSPAGAAMDKDAFKATQDRIDATYQSDKAQCASLKGNARGVCDAEANAKRKTAMAEAEADYKNTTKARTHAIVARADAEYSVAKKKCDDLSGTEKVVCATKANAARVRAKADARSKQEVIRKRDADYAIAIERCDSMSSQAKDQCVKNARARFDKS